ncbi:Na(+)-translocating NADH-quinone reductase subunit D (Na(+)-NQR subunit D) like [Actinidia chinensis var. chinensis]|uniref:Na(+)-translocating NADH-quinone reductase subunit D (Na(+)-NQR subunit D) like n=1 Tax=Actinidia chinensis var. chinensis TaxID=1590841 RepID=A0A2R6PB12_ACTCC|nr:Na(+)-translocating NADH-quinone reductase subunit D (Na(+)-NQR subunit D) like [Actinidia chinensis var. chinensis]
MAKQQSLFKVLLVDPCPVVPSTSSKETTISGSILFLTTVLAAILPLIPYEHAGRYRVPKAIFKGQLSTFHVFIVSIMFAFSGLFSALFIHKQPNMARLCRYYSMVAMVSAIVFMICASLSQTA